MTLVFGLLPRSRPARLLVGVAALVLFGVLLSLIAGVLLVSGGPPACTPGGGPIVVSDANADAFQRKWEDFERTLDRGRPASVTFTESEVTSRAKRRLDKQAGRVTQLQVCIHNGFAEATATLDLPGPFELREKVAGAVDMTAPHPHARVDDLSAGSLPGLLAEPFEGVVERALDRALEGVDLEHRGYRATLTEGQARIDAVP